MKQEIKTFLEMAEAATAWRKNKEINSLLTIDDIDYAKALDYLLLVKLKLPSFNEKFYHDRNKKVFSLFFTTSKPKKSDILVFLDSDLRINQYLPILKEIVERRISYTVVTSVFTVWRKMKKQGFNCIFVKDTSKKSENLIKSARNALADKKYFYKDVDLKPIIYNALDWIPSLLGYKDEIERIIRESNPKSILIECDSTPHGAIVMALAEIFKAQSFVLQHGLTSAEPPTGFFPILAEKLFVWEKDLMEMARELKSDNKTIIVGNPLFQVDPSERAKIKSRLGISEEDKVILVTLSQYLGKNNALYEEKLIELFSELSNIKKTKIVMKFHPFDDLSYCNKFKLKFPDIIYTRTPSLKTFLDKRIIAADMIDLIKISDVMIGHASTSILESWAMGKPAIEYDIFNDGIARIRDLEGKNNKEVILITKKCLSMDNEQLKKLKDKVIKKYLFESKNASKEIVDYLVL